MNVQPEYSFTADELWHAYKTQCDQGWDGDVGRTAAAHAMLGTQASDDEVHHVACLIRQAIEERTG